ncbi:hypothetical protein TNCV_3085411 [Trichonephila clavipes]|nr:hypothetical protein TNCV_3085411 [Trichonephila clavipes]
MNQIPICEASAKSNEMDSFLKHMLTGDGKWVIYNNIGQSDRGQSMEKQLKRCPNQEGSTVHLGDSPETPGLWLGSFDAFTV